MGQVSMGIATPFPDYARRYRPNSATIGIFAGGAFSDAAAVPEALGLDAAVVADVPFELRRVRFTPTVLAIALARGETTLTLVDKAAALSPVFSSLQQELRKSEPIETNQGLAMLRSLGLASVVVANAKGALVSRIERDLIIPLMRRKNGRLRHVEIVYFNSLAGGTGNAAGRAIAEISAEVLHRICSATVTVTGIQLGALTFLGFGQRLFNNAAVGLAEQLAYVQDPARHQRESRYLTLVELPSVDSGGIEIGTNRELRSRLAATLASSLYAPAVQQELLLQRSNRQLGRPFGAITLVQGSWYGLTDAERVGQAAAAHYHGELRKLSALAESAARPVQTVHVELSARTSHRPMSAEELIRVARDSGGVRPNDFETSCFAAPGFDCEVRVRAECGDQSLDAFLSPLDALRQVEQYRNAIFKIALMRPLLETKIAAIKTDEAQLTRTLSPAREALMKASDGLFLVRLRHRIAKSVVGYGLMTRTFRECHRKYHDLQTRQQKARASRQCLEDALRRTSQFSQAIEDIQLRFLRALSALSEGAPSIPLRFKPLGSVFSEMFEAVTSGDVSRLRRLLPPSLESVPLSGLATLVGAEPSAEGIAARLAGNPLFESCAWGGQDPAGEPYLKLFVLPQVDEQAFAQVRDAFKSLEGQHRFVCAQSAGCGLAVIELNIYDVDHSAEVLATQYQNGFHNALTVDKNLYPVTPSARTYWHQIKNPARVEGRKRKAVAGANDAS